MPKFLKFLLGLGLLLRIVISPFQYSGDIKNHDVWGKFVLTGDRSTIYQTKFPGFNDVNYPSLTLIFFGASSFLYLSTLNLVHFLNSQIQLFPSFLVPLLESDNFRFAFLKLPAIFADIGISILIYKFARLLKRNWMLPVIFVLFNPAVIYISSVWGQIESIPVFFILLAIYLYFTRQSLVLTLFCFALASLTKQTALWVAPVFFSIASRHNLQTNIKAVFLSIFLFVVLSSPFSKLQEVFTIYVSTLAGSSSSISDQAYNFWHFLFQGKQLSDQISLGFISIRTLSITIVAILYAFIFIKSLKSNKNTLEHIFIQLTLYSLIAFFFQTRVHERHLAPALFFASIPATFSSKGKLGYVFLSTYHMINLYTGLWLPFV